MLDTVVLPNGKVLILGGTEEGLSNLEVRPVSDLLCKGTRSQKNDDCCASFSCGIRASYLISSEGTKVTLAEDSVAHTVCPGHSCKDSQAVV